MSDIELRNRNGKIVGYDTETGEKVSVDFESVGTEELNGSVHVSPDDDVQAKLDEAGAAGSVDFEDGMYVVTAPLTPSNRQTWAVNEAVEFQPAGDNVVLDLTGVTGCAFEGTLRIADPNNNQTSAAAVTLDRTEGCHFDRLRLNGVYDGLRTYAESDGTKENEFDTIYATAIRNRGIWLNGQTHDNHFGTAIVLGDTGSDHGILINTDGIDGGNVFTDVLALGMGGDGIQVATLNREFWMGQVITDKNGGHGFNHFAGGNRATFVDTLWASGNGNTGVRLSGTTTDPVADVQFGQVYCIGNGSEGFIGEYVDGLQLGRLLSRDNTYAFRLANGRSDNVFVGHIQSGAHPNASTPANDNGLDCPDAGTNVRIASYYSPEGVTNMTDVETLERAWA